MLASRPEVLWEPLPRDLTDLAERLDDWTAVSATLQTASMPCLHVARCRGPGEGGAVSAARTSPEIKGSRIEGEGRRELGENREVAHVQRR